MKIWENAKEWGRGLMHRLAEAGAALAVPPGREYGDVFEIIEAPGLRQYYTSAIRLWHCLYRGAYEPWHTVAAPTIVNPNGRRQLYRLNAARAICAELAGLVWGEEAQIRVGAPGGEELDGFVQVVLRRNAFHGRMQGLVEQILALGGGAVKVWAEPGDAGETVIRLGYAAADQFVPLSWDDARVREGVFISRREWRGRTYTRLEWHRRRGGMYVIENELYSAAEQIGTGAQTDALGTRRPLAELYPGLQERTAIRTGDSLFSYIRTPMANNLDAACPLGMSLYGNALETLHALDICYDSFVSEFRLGRKRIIVPARCVRMVADPQTGAMRRYFDATDEVYAAFAADDAEGMKISDNSVQLRVEEHVAALNAFLAALCLQTGFSPSAFSFDPKGGIRTATEVVSENSRTFKTVRTVQNQLAGALEHIVRNIIDVAALYGMTWNGRSVASLAADGYEVKITFDDGVTQDRQTNLKEGVMLAGAGLLSRLTVLTDKRYGIGMTEAEARAELERVKSEQTARADVRDRFDTAE